MERKNRNLNHMPAGFCFTGFCGLCSLQGLWREGGHWCQYPSLTPRQKEEGGTERPPMGTLLFRMGILPAQFSGRWFYQCTHRGFQRFPQWSLCSHQTVGPGSPPDLSHRYLQRGHCPPSETWGYINLRSWGPAGLSHDTATICQEADGAPGRGLCGEMGGGP